MPSSLQCYFKNLTNKVINQIQCRWHTGCESKGAMNNKRIIWTALLTLIAATFAFTGCRTMEGAGEDIERGGEKIQDAAN